MRRAAGIDVLWFDTADLPRYLADGERRRWCDYVKPTSHKLVEPCTALRGEVILIVERVRSVHTGGDMYTSAVSAATCSPHLASTPP